MALIYENAENDLVLAGIGWREVVIGLGGGMHNAPSDWFVPEGVWDDFCDASGIDPDGVVWLATHSAGGREWEPVEEGYRPLFLEEDPHGRYDGWRLLRKGEAKRIALQSATSGSRLEATVKENGSWDIQLIVPVLEDGTPYQGAYWASFHNACRAAGVTPTAQ